MQKESTRSRRRYCSVKQLAEYLGLPEGTIYDFASQGTFPSIKIRKRVLFDIEEIDKLMEESKRNIDSPGKRINKLMGDL